MVLKHSAFNIKPFNLGCLFLMNLNNIETLIYSAYELNENPEINPKYVNVNTLKYIHIVYWL